MRTLFLLRGAPASGKSTWIEQNKLEQYTLSTDKIRLMYQSPILNTDGNLCITQQNDGVVWEYLFKLLEDKMRRGEFVVIDATHYKSSLINQYRDLVEKYRYRVYIVDFTKISKATLIERNSARDEYKRVPEFVIDKMTAVFEDDSEVPNRYKTISITEAGRLLRKRLIFNYNNFEKIVAFGDIHGCYEPLKTYFEQHPFDKNTAYIFTGDYIDRGLQNKEVLEFLISIMDEENVLMLEGNHEVWTRLYADECGAEESIPKEDLDLFKKYVKKKLISKSVLKDLEKNKIRSKVFKEDTIPQIKDISKKKLRQLCRKFGQFAYISFRGKDYVICHGGIPTTPKLVTSTEDLIKGIGKYEDLETVYASWIRNTTEDNILIHAHRNIQHFPTKVNDRIYNLCSEVEFGAPMRIIEITEGGIETLEVENPVYTERKVSTRYVPVLKHLTNNELLNQLNYSRDVNKKQLANDVVSYNFSRQVFNKRNWNELTCKARGMFVDTVTEKVICRSYDKFFNLGEREETKEYNLEHTLEFPVSGYRKENGFLGMVSYHDRIGELFIASKSTNVGDYADMVREQVEKLDQEKLVKVLTDNDITLIFEVINKDKDPHIIKYRKNQLILLDAVYNEFETKFVDYNTLINIASTLDVKLKEAELLFTDWKSFLDWKIEQDKSTETQYEGWVFEDSKLFRVKYKTQFYQFWKRMRTVKEHMQANKPVNKVFVDAEEVKIYNIMKSISPENLATMSIIDIQDIYYRPEELLLYGIGTL